MLSTLGLPSPRKNWLLRSVRTTSLSTVNCTFRQKALCSSGVMESLFCWISAYSFLFCTRSASLSSDVDSWL